MTRHPGRKGSAWEAARRQTLAGADVCAICGLELDWEAPPRSRWAPAVDHVVPLKLTRELDPGEQRRLALDPSLLRAVHTGCNSTRENRSRRRRLGGDVHVSREAGAW
jgi:hypothetical protein